MEKLAKIRQEKVEIEKAKLEIKAWEIDVTERMENLEWRVQEWEERDKVREARIHAFEEKFYRWEREGDTGSDADAASMVSGVRHRSRVSARSAASAASSVCISEKDATGLKRLLSPTGFECDKYCK